MYSVSVVIPNWNGIEKLKKNLPKVLRLLVQKLVLEVLVVDDASSDESVNLIEKDYPEVILIKKIRNEGFASTVNLGVARSKGDFIFLLNSDASPSSDCLKFALINFKDPKVFSVSCNTGGSYAWAKFENGFFWHYQAKERPTVAQQTLWTSGGSGIFRRSIWDELGGLDEIYNPFYEEDVDLGYRATKRGYINIWEPKSKVGHYVEEGVISANFPKERIQMIASRNQLIFIWKNITDKDLIKEHIKNLLIKLLTNPKYWLIFLSALIRFLKFQNKRKVEKKAEIVSDQAVLLRHKKYFTKNP